MSHDPVFLLATGGGGGSGGNEAEVLDMDKQMADVQRSLDNLGFGLEAPTLVTASAALLLLPLPALASAAPSSVSPF